MGVLVVQRADYAFRHSPMCEAVLAQLLPVERRILDERAAGALAERTTDDVVTGVSVSVQARESRTSRGRGADVAGRGRARRARVEGRPHEEEAP